MSSPVSRRALMGTVGLAGAAATLSSCTTATPGTPPGTDPAASVPLPSYHRFEGVTPDLVGTDTGVPDGFLTYPGDAPVTIPEKPASSAISFMCASDGGVAASPAQNSFWRGLNERLGGELEIRATPGSDYAAKLNTTLAGGDIPDVVQLNLAVPRLEELLPHRFTDLTEYLSADGVLDYPMLANFPTPVWKNVIMQGGLYGVPYPGVFVDSVLFVRSDLTEKLGIDLTAGSADEFLALCEAITDERENRWALGSGINVLKWANEMFGAPNQWRIESDGTFTRTWETEEFRNSVEYLATLHERGLFHPDTFSGGATTDHFNAGRLLIQSAGVMWWPNFYRDGAATPGFDVSPLLAPRHDGSGVASKYLLNGMYTFAGIKAGTDPDRVREILRVQNYLAAPFGTAEHLFRTYGEEGVHHTRDDDGPVLNQTGITEVSSLPVRFMSGMPTAIHTSGLPDATRANYELQKEVLAAGAIELPTLGLLAPAQGTTGSTIDRDLNDVVSEVVQGRKSLDDFDTAVAAWRTGGGDQIAEEYQAANEVA